jgi:acetate kinase
MGFTPLEGLMMGTRSGDLDPAIVSLIMNKENWSGAQVNDFLNKKCGVLGLSGVSSDFRDLEKAAEEGNYRAQLAIDVFVHDVKKYIGAYAALLDGVDGIIFTAGLGENSPLIRKSICDTLGYLGVSIDEEKNETRGQEVDISKWGAKCRVLVIPTNEELMIALDTKDIVKQLS